MARNRLRRTVSCSLLLAALVGCASNSGIRYGFGRKIAVLANREISESSGIAASRLTDGVLWTHNDSGDRPRVFAVDLRGEHLATLYVGDAANRDWEDMASFELAGVSYLLLADIGDNAARRPHCTLYFVAEPAVDPTRRGVDLHRPAATTVTFTYPDGPQNCESAAVVVGEDGDALDITVYLISKRGFFSHTVYALPITGLGHARRVGPLTAEPIATVAMLQPTAMDISPDGRRAVVATYLNALEFVRREDETWADAFGRPGRSILLPPRRQGEAVCFGRDGQTLYLTSETAPTPLLEMPVISPQPGEPGEQP